MIKNEDDYNKKELYTLTKLLGIKPVSKATKPMLISSINKMVDYLNTESGILLENPLASPSVSPKSSPSSESSASVDILLVHVDDEKPKPNRGRHPITGKLV